MTRYYDVQQVKEQGVLLQRIGDSQPRFNGRLAVVLDNGMRQAAPDVTDPAEYQYHYRNYFGGSWLSFTVYGLPADFGKEPATTNTQAEDTAAPPVWNWKQIGFAEKRPKRNSGNRAR